MIHIGAAVAASVPPVRGWASRPPWQGCWVVDGLPTAAATDAGKTTLVTPSVVYGVEMSGKDEYYNKAKQQGYRARSAYKLQQLDETAGLLGQGRTVVDLGAAPGG